MAVNTKNSKVLTWKEKQYSSIPGKYITSKDLLLHAGCVAWQFLTQEHHWKTVKFTNRLVRRKIPGHKDEMELQLLQRIPQARHRGQPEKATHPADKVAVEPQSRQPRYYPKAGTQRVLGAQIQQDHQGSRLLAKEARDRPQKVCERLLMFTEHICEHQACSYTAAIWLWLPWSGLQSSRSAVRIHWNEESLVHWQF